MEYPSLQQILFTFLILVIVVLKLGKRGKTRDCSSNPPPGPWKLPVIGNIHQLLGSPLHHRLRDLAKQHGPLMHLKLGEISTVVVSSAECAKEVMKTHDAVFASRSQTLATKIGFGPYDVYWKHLRKIFAEELLSTKRVQSYWPIREEEALNLMKWIASRAESPINLTQEIYSSTFSVTSRAAFGKKCKDQQDFIYIAKEAVKEAAGFALADIFPSVKLLHTIRQMSPTIKRLHKQANKTIGNIIAEHKQHMTTTNNSGVDELDLVDVLLKFQDTDAGAELSLTTDNIKAVILDLFIAGSEAPASTIDWAMAEMVKQPRIIKKAQDEVREVFNRIEKVNETDIIDMKYLKLVIKETLRLHPAAPLLLPRKCTERCEIGGYEILPETLVLVNTWAIGRDSNYWTEPDVFNPERFLDSSLDFQGTNFEYIPFGSGRRVCPGISFGLANIELPLAMFLYHFDWKLPNGMKNEDMDMTEAFGLAVRRKQDLRLIPIPYHPLS